MIIDEGSKVLNLLKCELVVHCLRIEVNYVS